MKIRDPEQIWDQRLNISTVGSDALGSDIYHYPYEPTPYCVLQRLVERKLLRREDCVVDYGCGKGRVGFFLRDTAPCWIPSGTFIVIVLVLPSTSLSAIDFSTP